MLKRLPLEIFLNAVPSDDPDAAPLMAFLRARRVRLYARRLRPHVGAMWRPGGVIIFNARYLTPQRLTRPYIVSLFLHEVCHLRQGVRVALSVYGELEAWQLGFRYMERQAGRVSHAAIQALLALPLRKDRAVLLEARHLMQAYAGKAYRADLLPLLPLGERFREGL